MKFKVGDRVKLKKEFVGKAGVDWTSGLNLFKDGDIVKIVHIVEINNRNIYKLESGWNLEENEIMSVNSDIIREKLGIK